MTGTAFPAAVQWALHGKEAGAEGHTVLACSTGELNRGNFTDAIGRFALGALDTLPQVSVSYLQPAARPGGSYLALAVNWFAVPGQRHAAGVGALDGHGRPIAFTSYFCAPYRQLAEHAVTYLDLYDAFSAVTLPVRDGPPVTVPVTVPVTASAGPAGRAPAFGDLGTRAAALLLTGAPVCVLGAERTTMRERLAFIDTVMALLPYGFRARMTAATWTKATHRNHRFRLFFSSAPRSAGQPDHVLTWNQPDQAVVPAGHARDYADWLTDKIAPMTRLPALTTEMSFGPKAATQALELVESHRARPRRPGSRLQERGGTGPVTGLVTGPATGPATGPLTGPAARDDPVARALEACAEHLRAGDVAALRSEIRSLEDLARAAGPDGARRTAYQAVIARAELLKPHPGLQEQEGGLYDALLAVAFGRPLGYQGYRQVEQCLGVKPGTAPHPALLSAMGRAGLADPVAAALVLSHLDHGKLRNWLKDADPVRLINLLARQWAYPVHARALCDVTLFYLESYQDRYRPDDVRQALRKHGFLAQALYLRHHNAEQYQFAALQRFLTAAYPAGLDRAAIAAVLTGGSGPPPTPALFAAVMKLATAPGDWELACTAYLTGSATLLDIDRSSSAQLRERIPGILPAETPAGALGSATGKWTLPG